mmetsp:Transcript_69118/g.202390  ORF Transcript_69118/g.202390 Transcript_69118/m.202390 type:complete len:85 (+) Transcript_69118:139-393(+)
MQCMLPLCFIATAGTTSLGTSQARVPQAMLSPEPQKAGCRDWRPHPPSPVGAVLAEPCCIPKVQAMAEVARPAPLCRCSGLCRN